MSEEGKEEFRVDVAARKGDLVILISKAPKQLQLCALLLTLANELQSSKNFRRVVAGGFHFEHEITVCKSKPEDL